MGVPVVYRKSGENTLANYNFIDLVTGTGYKTFYGTQLLEGSNIVYSFISDTLESLSNSTTSANNTKIDLDFDLQVVLPLKLSGVVIASVPLTYVIGGGTMNVATELKLYKVSTTGVETQLGSTATITRSAGSTSQFLLCGKFNIGDTNILKGEKLRLSVSIDAGGINNYGVISHSPTNNTYGTTGTGIITKMTLNLPFKVDL